MSDTLFYTSGEMAELCGVSRDTWGRWVRQGHAPKPVMIGNATRWLASDIDKWMKTLKKDSSVTRRAAKLVLRHG